MTCDQCDDTGVVQGRGHAPGCRPIRCAPECPVAVMRPCPACEKAALGEDLT